MKHNLFAGILMTVVIWAACSTTANADDTYLHITAASPSAYQAPYAMALSLDQKRLYVPVWIGYVPGDWRSCSGTACAGGLDVVNVESRTVERTVRLGLGRPAAVCVGDAFGIVLPSDYGVHFVDPVSFTVRGLTIGVGGRAQATWSDCALRQDGQSLYLAAGPPNAGGWPAISILDGNLDVRAEIRVSEGGVWYISRVPNEDKFYALVARGDPRYGTSPYQAYLAVVRGTEVSKLIPLPLPIQGTPQKIFFRPDKGVAYIPMNRYATSESGLFVVDIASDELIDFLPLGGIVAARFVDSTTAYITNASGLLYRWNLLSNELGTNCNWYGSPGGTPQWICDSLSGLLLQNATLEVIAGPGQDHDTAIVLARQDQLLFKELVRPTYTLPVVTSAATFLATPIAPGKLITIWGNGLSDSAEPKWASGFPLPTTLGGIKVLVGGVVAPLLYVSASQINLQAPYQFTGSTGGWASVQIFNSTGGLRQTCSGCRATKVDTGLFAAEIEGVKRPIVLNTSRNPQEFVAPSHPVLPGEWISLYATGLGEVSPQVAAGAAAPFHPLAVVTATVEAKLAGTVIPVDFAGLAPGFAGLYQVNILIPPDTQPGLQLLQLTVGSYTQYLLLPVGKL